MKKLIRVGNYLLLIKNHKIIIKARNYYIEGYGRVYFGDKRFNITKADTVATFTRADVRMLLAMKPKPARIARHDISDITRDSVAVGCTTIKWSEVEKIGKVV